MTAVGDIACAPGEPVTDSSCQQAATADLVQSLHPDGAIVLGDLQYEAGSAHDFTKSFDQAWGDVLPIAHALPGNHEYESGDAGAYFDTVGQDPDPGWSVWEVNDWRVYLLNSNCGDVDCDAELASFEADLAANPRTCSAIALHVPRFSSGEHHSDEAMRSFWQVAYDHGVDLALAGHDHDYERFVPLDPDGARDPEQGITSFVVGTGGRSLYPAGHTVDGSAYFQDETFGVLDLELRPDDFSWAFRGIDGSVVDEGNAACH